LQATAAIPIVFATTSDPVRSGFVASLSRPGGNLTGLSLMAPDLAGKRLELIKAVVPGASRVAMLWNASDEGTHVGLWVTLDRAHLSCMPSNVRFVLKAT
jgi:ABC-type uncharacterized transport system substrate-binding protein